MNLSQKSSKLYDAFSNATSTVGFLSGLTTFGIMRAVDVESWSSFVVAVLAGLTTAKIVKEIKGTPKQDPQDKAETPPTPQIK